MVRQNLMTVIDSNNWDQSVPQKAFAQTKKCHPKSNIEWIKFHHGGFGLGLKVKSDDIIPPSSEHAAIEIYQQSLDGGIFYTAFYCKDPAFKTIFDTLCQDLVIFCLNHPEIIKPAHAIVQRAKAWEALFSKGARGLGKQATMGLFAELTFVRDYLIPKKYDIKHWVGPNNASQDFDFNGFLIEIKNSSNDNTIKVSSLEQLQASLDMLLFVVNLKEDIDGINIDEIVHEIKNCLPVEQQNIFEDKLLLAGYLANKNYSESFVVNNNRIYEISHLFPHIEPNQITGIIAAKYTINLDDASAQELTLEVLNERL
jgi:hypothetical protein